jgi:AcrR family transcriptional regulator
MNAKRRKPAQSEPRAKGRSAEQTEPKAKGRKAEQSEATRRALIAVARELFAERGYAAVGTEEVVRRAEVTRGALYHHFRGKRDLFRAVYEETERELGESIAARIASSEDPWDLLVTGLRSFLDACQDPSLMQIGLIDAPSVLGWEEWREIGAEYGLGLVSAGLQNAMDAGVLRSQPVRPLAHLLLGALSEAGMVIANARGSAEVRRSIEEALVRLLEGMRV